MQFFKRKDSRSAAPAAQSAPQAVQGDQEDRQENPRKSPASPGVSEQPISVEAMAQSAVAAGFDRPRFFNLPNPIAAASTKGLGANAAQGARRAKTARKDSDAGGLKRYGLFALTLIAVGVVGMTSYRMFHQVKPVAPTLPTVVKTKKSSDATPVRSNALLIPPGASAASAVHAAAAAANSPQDQARALFLAASQNAVGVTSVTQVQPELFAVSYAVSGKSGQAWVDLNHHVVFIGTAVDAAGHVITPGGVAVAMGAVNTAAPAAPATPGSAPGSTPGETPGATAGVVYGPGGTEPAAMAAVLKDGQAGFWQGNPKATPIWAFVDPDSRVSMTLYKQVKPLIEAGRLRVFWIPVGIFNSESVPRAEYILSQVGQAFALETNYERFSKLSDFGGVPPNQGSLVMRERVMKNNALLTNLGQLAVPATLMCSNGQLVSAFGPRALMTLNLAQPCPASILAQVSANSTTP